VTSFNSWLGQVDAKLSDLDTQKLGIAVSGGGDSIALLRLAADWANTHSVALFAYTVDHDLRPEAASEVAFVRDLCTSLGLRHSTLKWRDWDGQGNLSQEARNARYKMMADAALKDGVSTIALGHTQDDQSETVLMALARRSGIDGLAAMPVARATNGVTWVRPLLGVSRQDLRDYLDAKQQTWIDDPTNDEPKYERVRMRNAKVQLGDLGLTARALADVAQHMQSVQAVLRAVTQTARHEICEAIGGAVRLDRTKFADQPAEIRRRLLVEALGYVAPQAGAPRKDAVAALLRGDTDASLAGCLVIHKRSHIWVAREPHAVRDIVCRITQVWDGKWRIHAEKPRHGLVIRALGENGLKSYPEWRDTALPRQVLLSSPAIWQGERLIDAPMVGQSADWSAELLFGKEVYHS